MEYTLLELIIERLLIQEYPRIIKLLVKPIFDLLHAHSDTLDVAVASEDEKLTGMCFSKLNAAIARTKALRGSFAKYRPQIAHYVYRFR